MFICRKERIFCKLEKMPATPSRYYSELSIPYAFPNWRFKTDRRQDIRGHQFKSRRSRSRRLIEWIPMMMRLTKPVMVGWMEGLINIQIFFPDADAAGKPFGIIDRLGQSYGRISGSEEWTDADECQLRRNVLWFSNLRQNNDDVFVLGGIVGDDAMNTAIQEYMETWEIQTSVALGFTFFMNKELGRDLNWFWYYWLSGRSRLVDQERCCARR